MSLQAPDPALPLIPADIGVITGPEVIGFNLNWGLLGVTVVQIYMYYLSFPYDPLFVKILVLFLGLLEFVSSLLMLVDNYRWFANGFGNLSGLNNPLISPFYAPMTDSVVGLMVQIFYCYRIWILRRSIWLPVIIAMFSLPQAGAGLADGILVHMRGTFTVEAMPAVATPLWYASVLVPDTMIAVVMTWTLLHSQSNVSSTNHIISKIVRLTIGTNALTAGVALMGLIAFIAFRDKPTLTGFFALIIGKLYVNSFLAHLNNRMILRQGQSNVIAFESTFHARSDPLEWETNNHDASQSISHDLQLNQLHIYETAKSSRSHLA
ncbi:hypothetical protein K435DRAFT_841915 [Dendrothele bispora CBS 962.96]|uniref:DUF6534 domain-containing protein n=1 Tax=Dendrothele bispora (strain CBS 962.96) TaxID=1314807 RepID=A0A4S8LK13_DENBC|nr:hypothetical protein K435DRAFT_841915 [Dendrothele bispora CBS 962.96]